MRCKCLVENSTCRIVQTILYSPNRRNRSKKQASTQLQDYRELFPSAANEMQMSYRTLYLSDGPKNLWNSVYWQGTVSSRLALKDRGIHTRFPVFILGRVFFFHCLLFVATKMQVVTITIIRCNCRMETLLDVALFCCLALFRETASVSLKKSITLLL